MKRAAFLFSLTVSLSCGPQVDSGDGDDDDTPIADDGSPPDDDGPVEDDGNTPTPDVGEPSPCTPGLDELCGDECVDLQTSNDHCGSCDNACPNPFSVGMCEAGVCPPNFECGGARTDFRDCNEVCAEAGHGCVEDAEGAAGCSGAYKLYYDIQGVDNCEAGIGEGTTLSASCTDPIDWEDKGGLTLSNPIAVACCCTQE